MRVLSRLAGWMLGAALTIGCDAAGPAAGLPAIGRPGEASQGPRAAVIVAFRGDVSVEPSSFVGATSFPAHAELQLLRDDRLVVGPESFVLVALHNGHIVRLNEGSSLRVDAMAAFEDPPAGTDIEQRFADALSPVERDDVELRGAITRVAGWNTRMNAAQTIAPQPAQSPPAVQAASAKTEKAEDDADAKPTGEATPQGGSQSDSPPTDAPVPGGGPARRASDGIKADQPLKNSGPSPTPPPSPPRDDKRGPGKPEADEKRSEESKDKESSTSADTKKGSSSKALDLRNTVDYIDLQGKRTSVDLPWPLRTVRLELAKCAGAGAKIKAQVRGKLLVALKINGVASKCVPGVIGKTVAPPDGWIEMTVQP